MSRRVPWVASVFIAAKVVYLFGAPFLQSEPILAEDRSAAGEEKASGCCDLKCKRILDAFERDPADNLHVLQQIASRQPCDRHCQLARALVEIGKASRAWEASSPGFLGESNRGAMDACFTLIEGRQVSGSLVVAEVLVDREGNPVKISLIRGISESDFNNCVRDTLSRVCYRPAFRGDRFIEGKMAVTIHIHLR